jgi:aquaporin Z
VEILYTTALALVVMNVATAPATAGNSFYGLAIGFTVGAGAFAGGPISGGAFNPAVGLGPALIHAIIGRGSIAHVWLYIVGPCIGAVIAAAIFKVQHAVAPAKA